MDDDERDVWLAYFELVCPRCGNLKAECSDPAVDWHPRTSVCWASASQDWARRRLQERYSGEEVDATALHPLDGRWVWVATSAPTVEEDEFL